MSTLNKKKHCAECGVGMYYLYNEMCMKCKIKLKDNSKFGKSIEKHCANCGKKFNTDNKLSKECICDACHIKANKKACLACKKISYPITCGMCKSCYSKSNFEICSQCFVKCWCVNSNNICTSCIIYNNYNNGS